MSQHTLPIDAILFSPSRLSLFIGVLLWGSTFSSPPFIQFVYLNQDGLMDICFTLWVRIYYHRYFFGYTNCPRFDQVTLWTQRCAKIRTQVCLVPRSAVFLAHHLPPCSQLSSQQPSPAAVLDQFPIGAPHRPVGCWLPAPVPSSRTDAWPRAVRCAQGQSVKLIQVDFFLQMGRGVSIKGIACRLLGSSR